jgi:restriction system protein
MTPDEYEGLVAAVLRREGWDATVTPSVRDMGLDVLAERGGVRLGIQAKMYRAANRPVNAEVVMLTYGACAYADCTRCMIATDGRVLKDAERVAAKLDVEIRIIPSTVPTHDDVGGAAEGAGDPQSFGRIWSEDVTALVGRTLHRANGRSNDILAVDTGGVVRRTSNGKTQRIDIDVFRWAIDRLLRGEAVLREDINARCVGRASSGVMLILSELPMFELITQGRKQGIRMRPPLHPPGHDLEASGGPGR